MVQTTTSVALVALASMGALTMADKLSLTPPMGWMSWEVFRCRTDCTDPTMCVGEVNYKQQADALVAGGFRAAGYKTISIDDCWERKIPERDAQGRLAPDPTRFPSGFKALADYMHAKNVSFGIYSDMGVRTCGGYPGSEDHELIDAQTFAEWGVDYLKLDGCNNVAPDVYAKGYPKMGMALQNSGREIVYSCSWPAYLGSNESDKPFEAMIQAGCNLWRNYHDIQGNWGSLSAIIDHWGDFGPVLQATAGPNGPYGGHWHDPDMLLIGEHELGGLPGITLEEGRTQFGMWSMFAAPLIMGNDLRNVSDEAKAVLLNEEVIAIDQDPLGKMALRVTSKGVTEVWARELSNGDLAVALLNKGSISPGVDTCQWKTYTGGYNESTGGANGNDGCENVNSIEEARATCCGLKSECTSVSVPVSGHGTSCYKKNDNAGWVKNSDYISVVKTSQGPQPPTPQSTTINASFHLVGWKSNVARVRDLFAKEDLGVLSSLSAKVAPHGVSLLRLSPV